MGALSSFAGSTLYSLSGSTSAITGIAAYFASFGGTPQVIATDGYNVSNVTGLTFAPLMRELLTSPSNFEQRSMVLAGSSAGLGALFGAGNRDYWTYQGASTTAWQFSLGKPWRSAVSQSIAGSSGGLSGYLTMFYSLVRQDGLFGPARAVTYGPLTGTTLINFTAPTNPNLAIGLTGGPSPVPYVTQNVTTGSFGLSGIQVWAQLNQGSIYQYGALIPLGQAGFTVGFGFTGASFFPPGISWGVQYVEPMDYQGAFIYGLGVTQGGIDTTPTSVDGQNPQCIEYYSGSLFSAIGNRVIFSNPGTPEQADYGNFFFVAQNEPLYVTSMKAFFTQLLIWKFGSTWSLGGSSSDTYSLTQASPIYGCISKNAACVWETKCWFLDAKGICEFNGANTAIVSNKVEDIFKRMNVSAASQVATMIHVKERNEVWCGIPVDGASFINLIVVYDYLSNAWTTRTVAGGNYSFLSPLTLGAARPVPYYGSASGMIGTYGSSLIGDNGVAATCIIKSRFITQFGNSIEAMYRRLYLDVTVPAGQTYNFLCNFYADKGTTPYYSVTMSIGAFQNRIDFGIPARSLAVEFIFGADSVLKLNGFTIESRFQRNC